MKNKLLFNLLTPFATSNTQGKTFRNLIALVMVVLGMGFSWGQLLQWNTFGNSGTETIEPSTFNNANISTSTLNYTGSAVNPSANSNRFGGSNWGTTASVSTDKYIQFTVTPTQGFSFTPTSFVFGWDRSSSGPANVALRSSTDGFATNIGTITSIAASQTNGNTITISGLTGLTAATTFRLYGYGATGSGGTGGLDVGSNIVNVQLNGTTALISPEINIKQSTTSYASASTYAFVNQVSGTSSSATTFTIENTGNATLNLSGSPIVAISGNTSEFTVDQTSTASTVATSGSTTFTVTFNPTSTGAKSAAISIANDDATGSESPYIINLTGTGTVNSSSASDIITQSGYSYASNIDYASKQTASSLTIANSVGVNGLTLRDGGATTDSDALGTTLTNVTFSTGGSTAIRTAALFDGTNKIAEVAVNGSTSIAFTGLSLGATDGGTKDFELRVTYQSSVTDNQQVIFTISAATASATNSGFAAANAGAAASSATGDDNRLEVTADRLIFVQQTSNVALNTAMSPAPTVSANDALANRDLDFTSSVRITSTGTLTGTPVDVIASSGLATFNSLTHTAVGSSLTLNAERTSGLDWDVTSNAFDITVQAPGLLLLEDNFTHSAILTSNGYTDISGTGTNNLIAGITGLTYTNYGSSNIGNGLAVTNNGQDVYRTFTSQNPGGGSLTVYCSALVSLSAVQTSGDYFLTLFESSVPGTYRARVYAKRGSTASKILFGIATSNGTVTYTTTEYDINTTILLVVKHLFTTTTSTSSLYINPSTLSEPTSANISDITASSVTTGLDAIVLRQGTAANAPTLVIDGIRVATNWGAVTGNPQYTDNTTIAAGNYNSITTYDGSTPSISGNVNVYNQLSILGGTLTTNNTLTLKSNANGTAQVAAIGSGGSITGNVTTERYIPARRAFRFLSPSVTTSTSSIKENWQENGGSTAGLGTHITGVDGITNGFDATSTNNPSLFTFNNSTGVWEAVTSTLTNSLTAGIPYRLMVRGDRLINLSTNTPTATPTVLRATGTLNVGDFSPTLNQASQGSSFVGNPYQATVDIKAVLDAATNMNNGVVYYWDPTLNARGGYVTRDLTNNNNTPTSSFNQYLQPGQAVFVKKLNTSSAASMTFTENNKSIGNAAAGVFRTANTSDYGLLRVNLQANTNNQWQTIEGALAIFNSGFNTAVTDEDATKMANLDEEVSFVQNNTSLAIACQPNPTATTELPIRLTNTRYTNYQWQFELDNYNGATPYLFDTLNNSYTQINNGTVVPFTADANTTNRFKIVFQNAVLNNATFHNTLAIYPNPAKAGASFYVEGISEATVTVSNLLGQTVPVQTKSQGTTLQVTPNTNLSQGVYLVNITTQGTTQQVKWIVE
jgi:hypothetical protein